MCFRGTSGARSALFLGSFEACGHRKKLRCISAQVLSSQGLAEGFFPPPSQLHQTTHAEMEVQTHPDRKPPAGYEEPRTYSQERVGAGQAGRGTATCLSRSHPPPGTEGAGEPWRPRAGGFPEPGGGASLLGCVSDGAGPRPSGRRAGLGARASRAGAGLGVRGVERSHRSAWAAVARVMAPAADRQGYWGPTTSTLDWCEENYAVTWYMAEFCECGASPAPA